MKNKIETSEDVQKLVRAFYKKVLKDDLLAPFFAHAVNHNWEGHLQTMDTFWNNVIFFTGGYEGNPLQAHKKMHDFTPLKAEHFNQWLYLFKETVDELFEGEKAELAKQRANSIATVMQIKILHPPGTDPIY